MIGRRILAFWIDLSFGIFLSESGIYILRKEIIAGTDPDDLFNPFRLWATASHHLGSLALALFLYFFLFLAVSSETPGLSVFGLTVVCESEEGNRKKIGAGRAVGRTLALAVSAMTLGLGFLLALANERRRALHDCISGTRVVREKTITASRPIESS